MIDFQNSVTDILSSKFAIKWSIKIPPDLKLFAIDLMKSKRQNDLAKEICYAFGRLSYYLVCVGMANTRLTKKN